MVKIVFIDPEPKSKNGGGIRTYISLMVELCRQNQIEVEVYSHNTSAYTHCPSYSITRKPHSNFILRKLLYKYFYPLNIQLEYSQGLAQNFLQKKYQHTFFEFCDFGGYAFYSLKQKILHPRVIIKIHTPMYLIQKMGFLSLNQFLQKKMELFCMKFTKTLTTPSARFVEQKLPTFKGAIYLPNPLPPPTPHEKLRPEGTLLKILYIGRVEKRKGTQILIQACQKIWSEGYPISLTLAGAWPDTNYAKILKQVLQQENEIDASRVNIVGEISKEKLSELFTSHNLCVIPSLWENSPYAFFEAVNAGVLTLGTHTGEMGVFREKLNQKPIVPGNVNDLYLALLKEMKTVYEQKPSITKQTTLYHNFYTNNISQNLNFYQDSLSNSL